MIRQTKENVDLTAQVAKELLDVLNDYDPDIGWMALNILLQMIATERADALKKLTSRSLQ